MAQDLQAGLTIDQVAEKPYRFVVEQFYWVRPEFVPQDDVHWETITLIDTRPDVSVTSKIVLPADEEVAII